MSIMQQRSLDEGRYTRRRYDTRVDINVRHLMWSIPGVEKKGYAKSLAVIPRG